MSDETTTDRLAEIEGQAADYTPPEGWRVLAVGEKLQPGDMTVRSDGYCYSTERVGYYVGVNQRYIRRIEPEPQPEPQPEPEPEPQPVQVREGRWRTRGGEIRHVTPTPHDYPYRNAERHSWHDASYHETWYPSGRYSLSGEHPLDLWEYLGPIEPEPDRIITPDDVAAETLAGVWDEAKATQEIAELQAQVRFLKNRELTLGTRLEEEKAVTAKRLQQVEELRSEVSHVQRLWGESRRRVEELETLVGDLRNINATAEKSVEAAARQNADLQHRLDTVAAEWAQQAETSRRLQIELDAAQQVPQAVSDRFKEGWDAGTARAVETIAEWTEPFRTCGSERLAWMVMQNLPHIMRSLTGLTDED